MVSDNDGESVYDKEIFDETQGKTFFAFINTCMSARIVQEPVIIGDVTYYIGYPTAQGMSPSDLAVGMPYAFTHQLVGPDMSTDGYTNWYGDSCYIGFEWGSPSLSQYVDGSFPSHLHWMWVWSFFWWALWNDITINDALNEASLTSFNESSGDSDLHNGFTAVWGETEPFDECRMNVYGNGYLRLYYSFNYLKDSIPFEMDGTIDNHEYLRGCTNDGNLAHIHCTNYDEAAGVMGIMSAEATGHIEIWGCSGGYNSDLKVYVSDDNVNWDLVNTITVTETSPYWIDVGWYEGWFRHIGVVGHATMDNVCLWLDSVRVSDV